MGHDTPAAVSTSPRWGEVGPRLWREPGEGVTTSQWNFLIGPPHPVPLPAGEREPALAAARERDHVMTPYFAYGSNMSAALMRRRCRTAAAIGPARLEHWR